jgi:hypothetical protein
MNLLQKGGFKIFLLKKWDKTMINVLKSWILRMKKKPLLKWEKFLHHPEEPGNCSRVIYTTPLEQTQDDVSVYLPGSIYPEIFGDGRSRGDWLPYGDTSRPVAPACTPAGTRAGSTR